MTPGWMERTRRVQEEVRWLLACGYISHREANQMLRADSTDPSKYRGQNTSMYITDENVLSVGLVDENGHEPDDPMYARQPIALRWDPSNDEEVFVNVDKVMFPYATQQYRVSGVRVHVNRTNVHLLDVPLADGPFVACAGIGFDLEPRSLSFRRDALVNKYGDYRLHLAITEKRPVGAHENRLVNDELILEWPRRPKRQKDLVWEKGHIYDKLASPPGEPARGESVNNPLADLYKRRYADYMPHELVEKARALAREQVAQDEALREAQARMNRALAEKLERHGRPTGELFGIDAAPGLRPWQARPLTREKVMEAFERLRGIDVKADESMPKNQAEIRAYSDQAPYGELIPGRKITITNIGSEKTKPAERKIVIPVPRFWGQLDEALSAPKKAVPPKEMPVVEPTPAGAEELIDWARADESRAAWAEKLSIPRVTRMLKEMTSYGKTWSESDLCALAGG